MTQEAMTLKDVAKRLHVSERTILRLLNDKEITGYKVGRDWRFDQSDIEGYIERQREGSLRKPASEVA